MSVVIAVSGMPGSGSTTIAKGIADRLNLGYYSPGEAFKGYSGIKKEAEAAIDVWEKFGKSREFHQKNFDQEQIMRAKAGNIVICGKLSIYMLRDIADFRIWIECDINVRAERTAKRDGIPFENALEEISSRERTERESWKAMYGIDYFDQKKMADIVIENSSLNERQALEKVMGFISSKSQGKVL
jgi:cytidylate kinase